MKCIIKIAFFIVTALSIGCSHYSTALRSDAENIINAPIDVVWEKTLEILPTERITLNMINKNDYFISARKHATFWSWGDDISIQLIPKGERQTIMIFDAGAKMQLIGWGHQERMVKSIFNRIKTASENVK